MPQVTRQFDIEREVEDTWEFFLTPDDVAPCVPGCKSVEETGEDEFTAEIQVDVAYTSLTFDADIALSDKRPPNAVHVDATAEPAGRMPGSSTVDADLEMEDVDGHTEGTITIAFAIRGRLGSLGESAFKHKCEELTEEFVENVTAELEQQGVTTE